MSYPIKARCCTVNSPQCVVVFVDQFAQAQIGTVFSTLVGAQYPGREYGLTACYTF